MRGPWLRPTGGVADSPAVSGFETATAGANAAVETPFGGPARNVEAEQPAAASNLPIAPDERIRPPRGTSQHKRPQRDTARALRRAPIARPRPPHRAQCGAAAGADDGAGVPARPASSLTRIPLCAMPRARRRYRVRRARTRRRVPAGFGSRRPRRRRSMRLRTPRPADTRDCRRRRARRRLRARPARPSPRRDGRRSVRASAQSAPRRRQRLARLAPGAVPYPAPAGYPLAPPHCTAAPKTHEPARGAYKAAAAVAGSARSRIAVTATTASALSPPACTR